MLSELSFWQSILTSNGWKCFLETNLSFFSTDSSTSEVIGLTNLIISITYFNYLALQKTVITSTFMTFSSALHRSLSTLGIKCGEEGDSILGGFGMVDSDNSYGDGLTL